MEYLEEDLYGKVLDSVVVACVDTIVINRNKILLGKRTNYPNKSWWFFGGRMMAGESFESAACRGLKRELGLSVEGTSVKMLGTYSLVWPKRRESKQTNGCHHLLTAMYVPIDDAQALAVSSKSDHSELVWIDVEAEPPEGSSKYLEDILKDLSIVLKGNPLSQESNPVVKIQ